MPVLPALMGALVRSCPTPSVPRRAAAQRRLLLALLGLLSASARAAF
jgi:hypothetical protein